MFKRENVARIVTRICLMVAVLSTSAAFAGTRDSGGGTGIMVGGRLVVLDLVEAGLEHGAAIPAVTAKPAIVATLKANLSLPEPLKSQVLMPLAAKLTEIDQFAHPAGITMAAAFGLYTFQAVGYKLTSVDDVDSAIGETKIQLAVRKGPSIFINVPNWNQLDDVNRVALLMHEIVYAFQPLPVGCSEVETGTIFSRQTELSCNGQLDAILATSSKARYMSSFFFRPNWRETWKTKLEHEMKDGDFSFSALYDLMAAYKDSKNRISHYLLKDDTMTPVFRALSLEANGHSGYLTSSSDLAQLCVLGEHAQPEKDWLGRSTGEDYIASQILAGGRPYVFARNFSLSFTLDVISVDGLGTEEVLVNSLPQFRSECVKMLRQVRRENIAD